MKQDLRVYDIRIHSSYDFWYIKDINNFTYMHSDGEMYEQMYNKDGVWTGLYHSKEEAQAVVNKYKPKSTVYNLKVGDVFKWVTEPGLNEDIRLNTVVRCNTFDWMLSEVDKQKISFYFICDDDPTNVLWICKNAEPEHGDIEIVSRKH